MPNLLPGRAICLVLSVVMGLSASASFAQFSGQPQTSKNPAITPDNPVLPQGGAALPGQNQLTPEQALGIMQLRALQSRGRGQVRTGVPQFIPMGPQGLMAPGNYSSTPTSTSARKSSSQKRAEARKVRDEQKKNAAADDAKAKKSKTKKAKPVKNKKPAKKAKADEKPVADK